MDKETSVCLYDLWSKFPEGPDKTLMSHLLKKITGIQWQNVKLEDFPAFIRSLPWQSLGPEAYTKLTIQQTSTTLRRLVRMAFDFGILELPEGWAIRSRGALREIVVSGITQADMLKLWREVDARRSKGVSSETPRKMGRPRSIKDVGALLLDYSKSMTVEQLAAKYQVSVKTIRKTLDVATADPSAKLHIGGFSRGVNLKILGSVEQLATRISVLEAERSKVLQRLQEIDQKILVAQKELRPAAKIYQETSVRMTAICQNYIQPLLVQKTSKLQARPL